MTAASMRPLLSLTALLVIIQVALSADGPNPGPGRPPAGTPGPWDADVVVYRASTDGKIEKTATFERAGVPTVARMKDGRLIAAHQYFPENDRENFDKVAVHFSSDEGKTWTPPEVLRLKGLPAEMRYPFDPTLMPLPDGRIRLYFTSLIGRRFEEHVPAIYSAISTNGLDYAFEPGVRFGVKGRFVIDCAVVLHKGVFHLYSPDNGAQEQGNTRGGPPKMEGQEGVGYHATSTDGLNFTRQADVKLEGNRRWLGGAQSDGKVITFYGTGVPLGFTPTLGQRGGNLWMATSSDGQAWQLVKSPLVMGADPGAVTLKDGGLLIVMTGEPRPGTASANRRPNNGGENFRPVIIMPLMKALDGNNDGMLDAEELANATAALRTLDRDGNGRLSGDEFRPPNVGQPQR